MLDKTPVSIGLLATKIQAAPDSGSLLP